MSKRLYDLYLLLVTLTDITNDFLSKPQENKKQIKFGKNLCYCESFTSCEFLIKSLSFFFALTIHCGNIALSMIILNFKKVYHP